MGTQERAVVLRRRRGADPPLRVGHRGAGAHCPHNSHRSFETAISMGVDLVETDVRRCASGEVLLAHDDHLEGADGSRLDVATTSLWDLRQVDLGGGERVLLLEDLLTLAQGRCGLMLDLKGEGFEKPMVNALRLSGFDPGRIIIPGGSLQSRETLREIGPEYALSLSLGGFPRDMPVDDVIERVETPAVTWHHSMLSAGNIEAIHRREKMVYAWTVDQEDVMRRLLRDGVDGIITNRPELLNQVLR